MRIPVAVTLESRDGTVSKDAKVLNGVVETKGDQAILRKRQGLSDLGQVWKQGTAQLLYTWNSLWSIYGDYLTYGTSSTIVSPSFTSWNSSDKGAGVTLSNSNLTMSATASNMVRASNGLSSGKFYWEVTVVSGTTLIGIAKSGASLSAYLGSDANGWAYAPDGTKFNSGSSSAYGATFTTGDVIGIALDLVNGTVTFYKNGTSQGTAYSSLSGTFYPAASSGSVASGSVTADFGASSFTYSVPSGYSAGVATAGTSLGPSTGGLRFDAQEVGSSAATQLIMLKNRTQAWTVTKAGVASLVSFPSSMGAATYSVSSVTRSGTTATATLNTDPGINVGDSITVAGANQAAYNVTANVTAVTPYTSNPSRNITISSLTRSGTTATAVTATAHGLTTSTAYTISGASDSAYNGSKTVTVTSDTSFTYTVTVTTFSAYGAGVTWDAGNKAANVTLSNGNLTGSVTRSGGTIVSGSVRATSGVSSGQYAWEVTINSAPYAGGVGVGVVDASFNVTSDFIGSGSSTHSWGYLDSTAGDVVGCALDMSAGTIRIFLNGVLHFTYSGVTGTVYPAISLSAGNGGTCTATANFGATSFTYSYDSPVSPGSGSPVVTVPASTTPATVSYTVSGSPTTPATGTITLTTNGGMVPGLPYIDGYFFVMDQNGVMWQSNSDDPTTWGALNFLTAQNENGKGKALAKSLNYLIAFKEWSTEFFNDTHNVTGFAFSPIDNGFTQVGCAHGDSVAKVDGNLVWLSQVKEFGRAVHLMAGLQQQKISTPDVERILNQDALTTVYALGVKVGGHAYYILTLVASNITLVYDLTSQAWTQWSSLTAGTPVSVSSITWADGVATVTTGSAHGVSDGDPVTIAGADQSSYNATFQATYVSSTVYTVPVSGAPVTPATGAITSTPYTSSYFKFTKYTDYLGANLFLHETNGHLYQMLPTLYQDAGVPIDLFVRTSRLDGGASNLKPMSRITVIGDALSDTAMVRWSDDDSQTFSTYRAVDLSLQRPALRRCGAFRRRSVEVRHVGNTNPRIEALELEVPQ